MLAIKYREIPGFDSLQFPSVCTEETEYYPLSPLSVILGYATPYSLIQSVPKIEKISLDELYAMSTMDDDFPPSLKEYKKALSIFKPLWFTTKEGINNILTRNTFNIPKIKEGIEELLGITLIHPVRKESSFYDVLSNLLKNENMSIKRHLYLAGYFVDMEIQSDLLKQPIIVEYDENNHKNYNKEKEQIRENALKQLGYTILRTNDYISPVEAATHVYKQILSSKENLIRF